MGSRVRVAQFQIAPVLEIIGIVLFLAVTGTPHEGFAKGDTVVGEAPTSDEPVMKEAEASGRERDVASVWSGGRCLFKKGDACLLASRFVTLEVLNQEKGAVVRMAPPGNAETQATRLEAVSPDLLKRVESGDMDADTAAQIEADLRQRSGMWYMVPSGPDDLKTDLGFMPDAVIEGNDYLDLLKVHLQMSWGVSPPTASYLVSQLDWVSKSGDGGTDDETNVDSSSETTDADTSSEDPNLISNRDGT